MIEKEKKLNSKNVYKGKIINLFVDDIETPNGVKSMREYVTHPGGVTILAFLDDKIILEKQYRYAYDEVVYELPAGKLEKGENPYDAGLRELEEETGYKAERLIDYGYFYPSVGYTNEKIYMFVAEGLTKTECRFDQDEYVETVLLTIDEVKTLIAENKIKDSKVICLLSKYLLGLKKN